MDYKGCNDMQDVNISQSKVQEMYMRWKLHGQTGGEDIQDRIRRQAALNMLWKGEGQVTLDVEAPVYRSVYEKLQDGLDPAEEEEEYLKQNDPESWEKVRSVVYENEKFEERLLRCRTVEEVERAAEERLDLIYTGHQMVESNAAMPMESKVEYALFKDARLSAVRSIRRRFMESEVYGALPTDAEYEREHGSLSKAEEEGPSLEEAEAKCRRAIDGYGNVIRLTGDEAGEKPTFGARG